MKTKRSRENPDTILEDLHRYRAAMAAKMKNWTDEEICDYYNSTPSPEEFLKQIQPQLSKKPKKILGEGWELPKTKRVKLPAHLLTEHDWVRSRGKSKRKTEQHA